VGFFVGGYFGAAGAQMVSDTSLRRVFAAVLMVVGGWMFFRH
jgi:uncharacterized membrane protein YfcA